MLFCQPLVISKVWAKIISTMFGQGQRPLRHLGISDRIATVYGGYVEDQDDNVQEGRISWETR